MRKLALSLMLLTGLALGGAAPASANAAAGLTTKPVVTSEALVEKVGFRRHHRRHGGLFIGLGYPGFYGYSNYRRHSYYNDYDYRPYRYYRRHHYRRHHFGHRRHW
jgi:hypothetical protein